MNRVLRLSLVAAAVFGLSSAAHAQSGCDAANDDNQINDTLVQNLRDQADTAEMRANTATNANDRARWEQVAMNLRSQAETQERNQRIIADGVRRICEVATHKADDDSGQSGSE